MSKRTNSIVAVTLLNDIIHNIHFAETHRNVTGSSDMEKEQVNWLKSLKDRVGCEVNCTTTKEWSEEDKNRINRLIAYFEDKESFTAEDDIVYANWLKCLKDRYTWKPSDEQMDMLKIAVSTSNSIVLDSLYNDLMKLKE